MDPTRTMLATKKDPFNLLDKTLRTTRKKIGMGTLMLVSILESAYG